MKNIHTAVLLISIACFVAACSKESPATGNTGTATNFGSYSFDSLSHTVRSAVQFGQALSVQDYSGSMVPSNNTSVVFYFATFPTHSGTYHIVPGNSTPSVAGGLSIVYGSSALGSNYQTGASSMGTATVTIDSLGKVSILIADPVTLVSQDNAADSGFFTANVRQQ